MEAYLQLFIDSLLVSTFIPTDGETTLHTMLYYGTYPKLLLVIISVLGAVAGLTINWLVGRLAQMVLSKTARFKTQESGYNKASGYANKYALALMLVGLFNQGEAVLTLIAGVLKVRLPIFLTSVAIGKFVYFWFLIFV